MKNEEKSIYKKDYIKNFESWSLRKEKLNNKNYTPPKVSEGDIFWVSFGVNIGKEIDGKGVDYARPAIVFKKINAVTFLIIPLTTSEKYNDTWHSTVSHGDKKSTACFNQVRVVDYKRIRSRVGVLGKEEFLSVKDKFEKLYTKQTASISWQAQSLRSDASAGALINIIADTDNLSNTKHNYNQEALDLHRKYGGKLETVSRFKLESREDLSRAYTPGVAEVCKEIFSEGEKFVERNEEKMLGLEKASREYTLKRNTIAIVSDGSAILGIGNLGAHASIPVMEGKAAILKEFAHVDAFPICLQSQDTEEIIKTIKNIAPVFGGINLEDISAPKCFEIEDRLRSELNIPVMHDDQWGAATVTLTAFINSLEIVNKEKENVRVVLSGVGAAGVATARLLISYGVKNIIFVDSKGIISKKRESGEILNKEKLELLESVNTHNIKGGLIDSVVDSDVFIGLSKPNVLTVDMVKSMNTDPVIFALANPHPEISVDDARAAGARIVATGRSDYPNQINNSLVFPGFWRGVLDSQYANTYKGIDNKVFIKIAKDLAQYTKQSGEGMSVNRILPDMLDKNCVKIVADSFK